MRTTAADVPVRLYHLDAESGAATTLLYGTLAEAMALAAGQDAATQDGLFLQTSDDVVGYLDLATG